MNFAGDIDGGGDPNDSLVNVNVEIREGADVSLDVNKTGVDSESVEKKKEKEIADSEIDVKKFAKHDKAKVSFHIATIIKPQEEYKIPVNNTNVPFEHVLLERNEDSLHFIHPLEKLSVMDFVDKNIGEMKPVKPLPLEETPFKLVEEVNDLKDLADKLRSVEEFAVDLEHNQYRSFQGLTCLMQISTRSEDFIVDTFKLWDHIGPYLREFFKDPTKKKVLHGADRDIIWLQRDFGIYVCNLFDTGQASRVLNLERHSLEFLLKHYCGVAANKEYQNADWRIRPLPDVMTRYAREDTHYLLYIYDVMRLDLHTKAKKDEQSDVPLVEVYKHSYDVCMQLYEKELFTENSYLHLYGVMAANFHSVQLAIVAGLCEWRDRVARAYDESTGYILPNKTLLDIARDMPIHDRSLRRLLRSKLPYVDSNIDAVVNVIRRSMQNAAAFEPIVRSLEQSRYGTVAGKNIETTIEEIGTKPVASSAKYLPAGSYSWGVSGTGLLGSGKVSVDVSRNQIGGFSGLPSKRKFESENKGNEDVKVSKPKPACVSNPDEVILLVDDEETDDAANRVSETSFKGPDTISMTPNPNTCGPEIIVLDDDTSDDYTSDDDDSDDDSSDDDDSDDDDDSGEDGDGTEMEDKGMSMRREKGIFMSMKPG